MKNRLQTKKSGNQDHKKPTQAHCQNNVVFFLKHCCTYFNNQKKEKMEPYLGLIIMWASNRIPDGWLLCNGQSLPVSGNEALYAIIGNAYGGNGVNFNLPNLVGRVPVGAGQGPNLTPRVLAQTGGSEKVALTTSQTPVHTHAVSITTGSVALGSNSGLKVSKTLASQTVPTSNSAIAAANTDYEDGSGTPVSVYNFGNNANQVALSGVINITTGGSPGSVAVNNGGMSHNNLQPTMGINYIICTQGLFPVNPN